MARGLTVAEEECYRAPLPLPPTNTSIQTSSKWPLEQCIPLPYLSLLLYEAFGCTDEWVYPPIIAEASFAETRLVPIETLIGGSTDKTVDNIATRPILQLCEVGGRLYGSTRWAVLVGTGRA